MQVAKETETYSVFHASSSCAGAYGTGTGLSIFRSFDESPVHYRGEQTQIAILEWMEKTSVPTLIEFSEDYIEPIFGKGRAALILFTNDRDAAYN